MRRSAILISISAIAVFGSACSSGSDGKAAEGKGQVSSTEWSASPSADPGSAVRAAVGAAEKSTARIDEEIRLTNEGKDFTIAVKGIFDMKADKGRLTASLGQTGGPAERAVPLDEVFSDGTIYFRMPGERNGDTGWRSTPRDKAEVHSLMRAPLNDPEHVLRQVAMANDVTEVGQEKVNGTSAVHYRGKLDRKALLLRMAQDRRAKLETPLEQLGDRLPAFADVWVSKGGQIVRIRLGCDFGDVKVTATVNLTDHGKPVAAPVPPKDAQAVAADSVGGPLTG
ncbi:hypothetical protein ACFYXH_40255 [Streptomyces sp. NPDC002730]|uniref:hypothetical protein n=1 Tax=Streptomyces sp. NPDC002730 TaxID=3364662 RepID=UPI0036C2744D